MGEKKFSKSEAIRFGWRIVEQNLGFFIPLQVVVGLITIVPPLAISILLVVSLLMRKSVLALTLMVNLIIVNNIIVGILKIIFSLGLIKISLNFCDDLKSKISDIFSQYRFFFRYLFASILQSLIALLGLILLIIPGIYLAIRLQFFPYFIVDRKCGIIESLKKSWLITQGNFWNLLLFDLLLSLINLVGILAMLIGLFVTLPITWVARAFVFRKLLSQSEISREANPAIEI